MLGNGNNNFSVESSRRLFLRLTAAATASSGLLTSSAVTASDEREESDSDQPPAESTSNEDILDAITDEEFKQAVDNIEYLGVDSQIQRFEQEIQGFPLQNTAFAVLSSGVAADAPGNPDEFASTNVEGRQIPNYSPDDFDAFNVAEFRIDFTVPEGAESIAFDYKFGTDESPEFLGSPYQDFFEAALLLPDGSATNIARLPDDTPVTVDNADNFANTPGGTSENPEPPLPEPPDTVYNAVTDLQTAERSIAGFEGEQLTLVLRIADATDGIFDSAAFIDNVRFGGEVDDQLRPIREAFDDWRLAVGSVPEELIRSEARAQAELYADHGDEYVQPMVDMLGYRAGEIPEGEINEEFLEIDQEISADLDQAEEQQAYEFYQEMFAQVSPDDDIDEMADTFFEYMMGTHSDQSNYFHLGGMTVDETIDHRLDQLDDYENQFLDDVQAKLDAGEYSGAEVQKIASFIEEKIDYMLESRIQAIRDENAVIENLTGPEDFDGEITIADLESEDGNVSTEAFVAGTIAGIAIKKVAGGAIGATAKKAGGAAVHGVKSSSVGQTIGSTAKSYGVGTKAQTAWLSQKSSTAVTMWKKTVPDWATYLIPKTTGGFLSKVTGKFIVEALDNKLEFILGWPPQAQLDKYLWELTIDGTIEQDYTSPDQCLLKFEETISIDDVSTSDIGPTDYDEGIYPPYGRQTGEVTITNTGQTEIEPTLEASLYGRDLPPAGLTLELDYPLSFIDPMPELEPGESETIEFEYSVPIGLWTSGYEVHIEFPRGDETVIDSFEAGAFSALSSVVDVAAGALSDGESESHEYQIGQAVGTQTTQQELESVTFEMEYSGADADLHLYDQDGNHVGQNYETGEFENQIDGAEHSGHDDGALDNEWVTVDDPDTTYDVEVVVPELETIIQTESTDSEAQLVQQSGGGTVEYDIEATEVPDVSGKLDAAVPAGAFEQVNEPAQTTLTISEVSEQESVSDITLNADNLSRDDDVISGDRITFDKQEFEIGAGQTEQVNVQIDQPEDFLPGNYSGKVTIDGNDGEVTHDETINLVVDPPVPYSNAEGIVETDGLREAIDDWRTDLIETDSLRDVIDVWRSGQSAE